jgi:hypothetical protein
MGVPTSEVGYTSATNRRGGHEVPKGHVVSLGKKLEQSIFPVFTMHYNNKYTLRYDMKNIYPRNVSNKILDF